MPSYRYKALTTGGERTVGVVAAATEQAALLELETRRLTPVEVVSESERASASLGSSRARPSTRALATAYTQLGDLLRAGVPILRSLKLLGGQQADRRLAAVFGEIAGAIEDGSDLAEAMAQRPMVFPRIHVAMVRAAEKGGFLEQVMTRLGAFLTAQADMRAKVAGNLIYPAVLVTTMTVVAGLIFGVFVPKLRAVLPAESLPFVTKFVFFLSDLVRGYGLVVAAIVAVAAVVVWRMRARPGVRRWLARAQVETPVIGPLLTAIVVARFCRVLGTMLENSIPMVSAMQIAKEAAGNQTLERAIAEATECVERGEQMGAPLARSGLFPEDVVEMISVGESANNLDQVLITIADTLEKRIDRLSSAAVKLIEPILIVLIAIVVFIVAMAVVLPLSSMGQNLK